MADDNTKYAWPAAEQRSLIGKRISRVDGPDKVAGRAKYTYDVHRPGMLYGKVVRSPYAHAKVVSVDTSAAEKIPGVKAVHVVQGPGSEIHWAGDDVVVVAAVDEPTAADGARAVKVEYEPLPHWVNDFDQPKNVAADNGPLTLEDLIGMFRNQVPEPQVISKINEHGISFKVEEGMVAQMRENKVGEGVISALQAAPVKEAVKSASHYKKEAEQLRGEPDAAFQQAEVVSEGIYGCPVVTHCCLESHGSIAESTAVDHPLVHMSTK